MAKEYKAGDRYYLPVCVNEIDSGYLYSVRIAFNNGDGNNEGHNAIKNEPDLLLTATEIAENGLGRRCGECLPMYDEVVAERDNLKADLTTQKEVNEELKAWYEEANKTATEAAEANDELKAKIADLRNRVGEQLAQIQDLNAEVHFHKEFGEGLDKQQKELQARYDELDSVNKEQAEKIRKLDAERDTWERNAKAWKMTADGMSKRAEELQAENEKLNNRNKYLESENNRKPIVHVLTNDGHVYAFTSSGKVSVKYHTELNILMIEDGEKTIAGFSRGDKPGNLSAWWMG